MELRALTRSFAVTAATAGLIATGIGTASAATLAQGGNTPMTGGMTATGMAKASGMAKAPGAAAAAAASSNVHVEVVMPLPRDVTYRDHAYYRDGERVKLPAGYTVKDGDIYGPDGIALAPAGKHEEVVSVPVACHGGLFEFSPVTTSNWIGNVINGAFNAARAGVEAAAGIAQAATGAASTPGAKC